MAKLNMAYLSSLKNRAELLSSYLPVSPSRVLRAPGTSPYHLVPKHLRYTWPRPEQSHLLPEACSPDGTDKRRQRQRRTKRPPPEPSNILKRFYALYDDKIRYFKKKVSKLYCLFNRNPPYVPIWEHRKKPFREKNLRRYTVKQKIEIFVGSRISKFLRPAQRYDDFKLIKVVKVVKVAKPLVMAKLNMAYLSSLKNRAKLLSSYLPVSPSRVLRAPGTSPYHLVPKHLRATWPRPEQSHLLPEACSPDGTDKRRQRQRRTKRPPPEPSNILKRFYALYDDKIRYFKKKVSKLYCLFNRNPPYVPIWEHRKKPFREKNLRR